MLIKPYRDRDDDLGALAALSARSDCTSRKRAEIDTEIRKIRAGQKGEREAAYVIDFFLAKRADWAVIHDLRLEWLGRVAQIDHLLINRMLHVWLCESKHFSDGVSINEHGEFTAFHMGKPRGIESPVEQNHRHVKVLESVVGSTILELPTRLGLPLRPTFRSVVLVSAQARITRPKQSFPGLETVVKADQLRSTINRTVDAMGVAETFLAATKIVSGETLNAFARNLVRLHRPLKVDWTSRFGFASEATPTSVDRSPVRPIGSASENKTSPKISTSKLAAALGLRTAGALLDRMEREGWLVRGENGYSLTETGVAAGGELVEKSRYGPYFLWPETTRLST